MAKIALRSYLHEIESLIEKGLTEEAAEHCKYILQSYPKLLAAYRLLGKAYLEKQRYADAADLFQRVLSSAPDDFVSHVGMSIVREDEGNLDAAIWHMQRAFEVQPYNAAIQGELKRLHGRRDGLEPPKVRLTRGALARMYARGTLYQQAIGELRAALAEDAQRPDLQVLLAHMYFLSGMKIESVEMCSSLIKKLPYCLEANRILAIILPQTDRKEDSQIYQQRVASLDPYLVHASPEAASSDDVPENLVSIDKYDIQLSPSPVARPEQPSWAASLGVSLESLQPKEDTLPDWLTAPSPETEKTGQPAALPPAPSGEAAAPEITGETAQPAIPDWMKTAGWGPSTGSEEIPAPEETVETPEGEITPGEVPEWLKTMAPSELEENLPPSETGAEGTSLPWEQEAAASPEETGLPWSVESIENESSASIETGAAAVVPAIPDWLQDLNKEEPVSAEVKPAQIQEQPVVESPVVELPRSEVEPEQVPAARPEETGAVPAEVPDWLKAMEPGPMIETTAQVTTSPADEEAALAWLEGLAAKQGVPEEELISKPEDRVAAPPTWVQEQAVETIPLEEAPAAVEPVLQEAGPEALTTPIQETPAAPEDMSVESFAEQEEGIEIQAGPGEIPDWLKGLGDETGLTTGGVEEQAEVVDEIKAEQIQPEWLEEITITAPQGLAEPPQAPAAEAAMPEETAGLSWLESLAAEAVTPVEETNLQPEEPIEAQPPWKQEQVPAETVSESPEAVPESAAAILEPVQEQPEEEPIATPDERIETPVEWVQETAQAGETPEETGPEASLIDEASAMAWLENLAARQGVPEDELTSKPEERPETAPEWVQEMAAQETSAAEIVPHEPAAAVEASITEQAPTETPEPFAAPVEEKEEPVTAIAAEPAETAQEGEPELPSWLLETAEEKEKESWTPPEVGVEETNLPLVDINAASLVELESLPGVGFILAQKIIDYREKCGPYTRLEDLAGVPGLSMETLNDFKDRITVVKPSPQESASIEDIQSQAGVVEDATLIQARNALIQGRLDEMNQNYDLLIKNESMLDEVIRDLREALYRYPMEIPIWQSLGDAYMRNNQLQEALDAYSKAEELLR
ncbi:MAG: helix-hairpin-helix domain-containing protein [Omnitrophica WOR_2 bacterium]